MARKLAGLFGIVVASLVLCLGTAAGAVRPHQSAGHQVLAEDKGPTVISPLAP